MYEQQIIWECLWSIVNGAIKSNATKIVMTLDQKLSFICVEDNGECFDQLKFRFLRNREILLNNLKFMCKVLEFRYKCDKKVISRKFLMGKECIGTLDVVKENNTTLNTLIKINELFLMSNNYDHNVHMPFIIFFLNEMAYLYFTVAFEIYLGEENITLSEKRRTINSKHYCLILKSLNLQPVSAFCNDYEIYGFISTNNNIKHQLFIINEQQTFKSNIHLCFNKLVDEILIIQKKGVPNICECWVHNNSPKSGKSLVYAITVECPNEWVTFEKKIDKETISFKRDYYFLNALYQLVTNYSVLIHDNYITQSKVKENISSNDGSFAFSFNYNNYSRASLKNCFAQIPQELLEMPEQCLMDTIDESCFDNAFVDIDKQITVINQSFKNDGIVFSKDFFKRIQIVGQIEKKFIAAIYVTASSDCTPYIILFDQHAVDERIHLEALIEAEICGKGQFSSTSLDNPIKFVVTRGELLTLHYVSARLKNIGFICSTDNDNLVLIVSSIPTILFKYVKFNLQFQMYDVIKDIVKCEMKFFRENGHISSTFPFYYHKILCREACKRAIKFGQPLCKNEIEYLFKSLSQCYAPFQCAHGRPILTVICKFIDEEIKIPAPTLQNILLSQEILRK